MRTPNSSVFSSLSALEALRFGDLIGHLKMDNNSSVEVDRNIREISGDSDDESDLNLSFGEEDLEDNLSLRRRYV